MGPYCTLTLEAQSGSTDAIQNLQIWNPARLRLVPTNASSAGGGGQIIRGCCTRKEGSGGDLFRLFHCTLLVEFPNVFDIRLNVSFLFCSLFLSSNRSV